MSPLLPAIYIINLEVRVNNEVSMLPRNTKVGTLIKTHQAGTVLAVCIAGRGSTGEVQCSEFKKKGNANKVLLVRKQSSADGNRLKKVQFKQRYGQE